VFIAEFFDAVTDIVRGGLLRQYRERDEDLRVVRGRIMTARQFANLANRLDVVSCRYDDLTADNLWNRSLKAGLRVVRPWIGSVDLYRRWVELTAVFDEVSDVKPRLRELERLVFDRQAARYRVAVRWVHWILSLLSPALRAGENVAPALLFDMNLLFQEAVAALLRRRVAADPSIRVDTQQSDRHLAVIDDTEIGAFKLTPDVVVRRGAEIVAVADTKWKRLQLSRSGHLMPIEADIYQMNAYAAAFRCDELTLMYPWFDALVSSRETSFVLPGATVKQRVHVLCLEVGKDPPEVIRGAHASPIGRLLSPELSPEAISLLRGLGAGPDAT
jgi:5-methylcytosine-specific restriction enzyme subunit McrC